MMDLTPYRTVLLAAHFAAETDLSSFRTLVSLQPVALHPAISLDLLLHFLPESTPPQNYIQLIQDLTTNRTLDPTNQNLDTSFVSDITEQSASKTLESLEFHGRWTPSPPDIDILSPWLRS